MSKLDSSSYRLLLSALEVLNSDYLPETLSKRAVTAAGMLVSGDWLTFDFFAGAERYEDTAWSNDPASLTPDVFEPFARYLDEHPIIEKCLARPDGQALKVTDVVSQREFEKTSLYNEFYRKMNVNRQMGLALITEGQLTMTCAFSRKGEDYSDKEKAVMSLAAPHFINTIRNGFAIARLSRALEGGSTGVISYSRGRATFVSSFARYLLGRYFSDSECGNRIPKLVSEWMEASLARPWGSEYSRPAPPLRVSSAEGTLSLRMLEDCSGPEHIFLLEEKRSLQLRDLAELPITRREKEVLYWIARGKSDTEIAVLLSISPRTAQKHVEHIYTKLGVESRLAAASLVMDLR